MNASGRVAVTVGSFWRSEPAAALRGFAKRRSPALSWRSLSSWNAASGKKLPYDPVNDFAPIGAIGSTPLVVVVPKDSPIKTLRELVELLEDLEVKLAGTSTILRKTRGPLVP